MDMNKYNIERRYIDKRQNVRPGLRLVSGTPGFFVAHDSGNPGATAENHFKYFQNLVGRSASAHVFIDDRQILEIIPTGTGSDPAEKAWHVLYNVMTDNERFGDDANDIALGTELCYGGKIDFNASYDRYVWYLAYCCKKWDKNPLICIATHRQLDPARKSDCEQALATGGKTLKDLLYDVKTVMEDKTPVPLDFAPLSVYLARTLIDTYVRPTWKAEHDAGNTEAAAHYSRLADNIRSAAGVDADFKPLAAAIKLPKSNAQECIIRWLSPAWFAAQAKGNTEGKQHFNNFANALRAAAGMPQE